jgi:hypothetical protein
MQLNLVPHPKTPTSGPPFKVWVNVEHSGAFGVTATTNIWFCVGAPAERFTIPALEEEPSRKEDLWDTTCFEAFLRIPGADAYQEWNFAPSGDWAAYDFTSHREGRTDADVNAPYIRVEDNLTWWAMGATISVDAAATWALGVAAILEEKDGTKSYWAMAHPPGEKPDFHDPTCFAAHLP